MNKYFVYFILLSLTIYSSTQAVFALSDSDKVFAQILYTFNSGDYQGALNKLNAIESKEFKPLAHYWKGICNSKLQKYDQAVNEYKTALELGATPLDIYYELGQAYYSILDYKHAKESFKQSVLKRFKVSESFYYLGYMELSEENFEQAIRYTKQILEKEKVNSELNQAAYFQIGEAYLGNIEKNNKRITPEVRTTVTQYVLPMYDKALEEKTDNNLANQIYARKENVNQKYGIKRKAFYNGRPFPTKLTELYISEKISYDTNVLLESSDADQKATSKSSGVLNTNAYISTQAIHRSRVVFAPEFLFSHVRHLNRDNYQVYQNDTQAFLPGLKTTLEHRMFDRPASFHIDLVYNHTKRRVDVPADSSMKKYGNTISVSMSEKMEMVAGTNTAFKYFYKQFSAPDDTKSTRDNGLYLTHTIFKKTGQVYFIDLGLNVVDANNVTLSSDQIISRFTVLKPNSLFKFDTLYGLGITAKNMKKMKDTRGTEVTYSPFIILTKTYLNKWNVNFSYSFNKQTSKNKEVYAYNQSIFAAELKYMFF